MKNFPHQYNQFGKLRATLEVVAQLSSSGRAVRSDDVLGYELARRTIYRFRGFDYLSADVEGRLDDRIGGERAKPASNQGARTASRDLRRTLMLLGWLDSNADLTSAGSEFLSTESDSEDEQALFATSLLQLTLTDNEGESHPIRILLRLAQEFSFQSRDGMELALEAHDDSEAEFDRIRHLAGMTHPERRVALADVGVTDYQLDNAVKILPTFAEDSGLLAWTESGYELTGQGIAAVRVGYESGRLSLRPEVQGPTESIRQHPTPVAADIVGRSRLPSGGFPQGRTLEQQMESTRLLAERDERHQEIVRVVAAMVTDSELYEYPYDLLVVPRDTDCPLILWEAKTVDTDAAAQTRAAVGQLLYYEYFEVRPHWDREIAKAAVFDAAIGDQLAELLDFLGIAAFVVRHTIEPLNESALRIEASIFPCI